MRKPVHLVAIYLLPVIFLVFGITFDRARYANDPDYIYLVNALNLLKFEPVGHVDNPGTTVMEASAVTIAIASIFIPSHNQALVNQVILDPQRYIDIISGTLIVFNALLILLVGWMVLRKTGSLWYALLLQITPFLSVNLLEHVWTKVSPEPMLFTVSTLMALTLVWFLYDPRKYSFKYVILFSLLSGFGVATKATFLPLLAIPVVLLPGLKRKGLYLAGTIAAFVFFTSPAIPEYRHMFQWFYRLSTHTGTYGHGELGIIDPVVYAGNLVKIIQANPVFSAVLFISMVIMILTVTVPSLRRKIRKYQALKMLFAVTLTMALSVFMVAKHYHANHYLLPVLSLTGLALFMIIVTLENLIGPVRHFRLLPPAMILFLSAVILAWHVPYMKQADYYYRITNEEYDSTYALIDQEYPEHTRVYYYPNSINKFSALKFGNEYAKRRNLAELKSVYPDCYFYDVRTYLFYNWDAEMNLEDILRTLGSKIILISRSITGNAEEEIRQRGFPVNEIYSGRLQSVYELDTTAIGPLLASIHVPPKERFSCDTDTLTDDRSSFVNNHRTFNGGSLQTSEHSRSGLYSVRLDKDHPYGMDFTLTGCKEGEQYRISIWRYGDDYHGHLVAAAPRAELYYKSVNDYIQSDSSGWKQLVMYVTIPPGLGDQPLKVYLWNSGDNPVYFDDLEVIKR